MQSQSTTIDARLSRIITSGLDMAGLKGGKPPRVGVIIGGTGGETIGKGRVWLTNGSGHGIASPQSQCPSISTLTMTACKNEYQF